MPTEPSIHPFPGLRPFEENEQDLFFGREGQSEEILGRLRAHRFVAVVGASGSGKSSLVRAGLLPYLHGGFLAQASSHWRIAIFRPGGDPIKNLAVALDDPHVLGRIADSADAAAQSAMLLEVTLRRGGLGLIEAVRLARLPEDEQVLVVVDQFEELFRFASAADRPGREEDASAFIKLLLEASAQRELPIYVVLTMRSDYIGDCARYRDLPEAVTKGLYLIPRMTRDQRRAAIVEPVRVGGGKMTPRLVTRLLNDVGDDPDQLPILQHALMRTWDYWTTHGGGTRPIDVEDYLAIGGMADALSQHADEAYAALPDDRHRDIAKRVFQALSEKGPDNREARRPTTLGKLAAVVEAPVAELVRVLDEFRAAGRSFLTPAANAPLIAESVIDISHESLIRGWRRMRQWVEEEAESARVYRRLADTASLHAQGIAGLLRDPDLENVLAWRSKENPNAAWGERYHSGFGQAMAFLEESRFARDAERRQREAARRRLQIAGGAAAALITIVAVVALWQWHQADLAGNSARRALATTTGLANSLVYDIGQDPRLSSIPPEMQMAIYDRAIQGDDEVIKVAPSAAAYTGRSAAYYHKKDYDHALADAEAAIKLNPKFARAYNVRGNVYLDRGDYDRAIADYDKTIALNPKFVFSYANRANAYKAKGDIEHLTADYDKALADYGQAIALDPKYVISLTGRGSVYNAEKKYDLAIAAFAQAIALVPTFQFAYSGRGFSYLGKSDYDHAIADFSQAISLDSKLTAAYNGRGLAYHFGKKNYDRAIADYSQAIVLSPKFATSYVNRGNAYVAKGDIDHALADFDQAVKIDPNSTYALNSRGEAYYGKKDYDRAISDYDQSIKLDPKSISTFLDRGNAYKAKGDLDGRNAAHDQATADYKRAIADYDTAIKFDPNSAAAYTNLGNVHSAQGGLDDSFAEYDLAIADYDQAIAVDQKYSLAFANRGIVHRAKRELDAAIADLDKAIALDAKFAVAYDRRGEVYLGKGDLAHAGADFDQAIELDPKLADSYTDRALGLEINGDLERSLSAYDRAIMLDSTSAFAFFARGGANFYAGHSSAAVKDAAEAVKLYPANAIFVVSLYIARIRAGDSGAWDEFVANTQKLDKRKWPWPIIGMYLGSVTVEQLDKSVQSAPTAEVRRGHACQEDFYLAMLRQIKGAKGEARSLFKAAEETCPHDYTGYAEAKFELKDDTAAAKPGDNLNGSAH